MHFAGTLPVISRCVITCHLLPAFNLCAYTKFKRGFEIRLADFINLWNLLPMINSECCLLKRKLCCVIVAKSYAVEMSIPTYIFYLHWKQIRFVICIFLSSALIINYLFINSTIMSSRKWAPRRFYTFNINSGSLFILFYRIFKIQDMGLHIYEVKSWIRLF